MNRGRDQTPPHGRSSLSSGGRRLILQVVGGEERKQSPSAAKRKRGPTRKRGFHCEGTTIRGMHLRQGKAKHLYNDSQE